MNVRHTLEYQPIPTPSRGHVTGAHAVAMLLCLGAYVASVWAGGKWGGEDGGWFLLPGFLSFAGIFVIPVCAITRRPRSPE